MRASHPINKASYEHKEEVDYNSLSSSEQDEVIREKIIVALDVDSKKEAEEIVRRLAGKVGAFKIGLQLQLKIDENFLKHIEDTAKKDKILFKIFLDYKYHDIENTTEKAVRQACTYNNISFLTIHGEKSVIESAVRGRGDNKGVKILAVTVLTNMDEQCVKDEGYKLSLQDLVLHRAENAIQGGADGVIASAKEASLLRERYSCRELLIVTPGIRLKQDSPDDQKRIATPHEAISNGADYLVVGRSITRAKDMEAAVKSYYHEIDRAMSGVSDNKCL